ncbi:MAG: alkaline phosphatase family protein [Candidatus Thorarchaeota archaeon]
MKRRKLNIILSWFVIICILQISFGTRAAFSQFDLNNRLNIKDDVLPISLIDTPENITDQFLIIFVDGMRYDRMLDGNTPNLDAIRLNGTTFSNFRSVQPSYSTVNYAAFSTGSSTNLTDVYSNAYDKKLEIPTFYDVINANSDLSLGIVTGSSTWARILGDPSDVVMEADYGYHAINEDENTFNAAIDTISANFSKIQFVTFGDVDGTGHEFGAASEEYIEVIELTDEYIGEIVQLYSDLGQLEDTTIIVFSDHGMADVGAHGGTGDQETHATLILAGKGIKFQGITTDKLTGINCVAPTILAMLGFPPSTTMNGKILYDFIDISDKDKAIYAIQAAQIMNQQMNLTLNKMGLISKTSRNNYLLEIDYINGNISVAKNHYIALSNYTDTFERAQESETNARIFLSALYYQYSAVAKLLRNLIILGIITLVIFTMFFLWRRKIIEITHSEVITKELIISEILGAGLTSLIIVGMFLIFDFNYSTATFNSPSQALTPNMTALALLLILGIFSPWLFTYLLLRKKKQEFKSFKEWKKPFLRASIGSIAIISLPIFGYFIYYISRFGPWPNWFLPIIDDAYAFMVISVLSCLVYIVAIIFIIILKMRSKKTIESAAEISGVIPK